MTTANVTKKKLVNASSEELPNNPFVFEVLQLINKQRTSEKKVEVLKKYEHPSLKSIFIWNFDDNVISMLPEGDVPYSTVSDDLVKTGSVSKMIEKEVEKMEVYDTSSVSYTEKIRSGHTTLRSEYTKLINFVRSASGAPGNSSINALRRENMFIQMLEGLHPFDAEIMCLVKDKKLQSKYKITKEIVGEAYTDIKWGNR
jgi:hypothetical protein